MSALKNCHSPAGMGFSTQGTRLTLLEDCPKCKFGTVDVRSETKAVCADCGAEFIPKVKEAKRPKKMSEVVPD